MNSPLKLTLTILFFSIFTFAFSVHAQIPSSIDGIEMSTDPVNPSPLRNVSIKVESFQTDLNAASIVWMVDGKNYSQGTGLKSIGVEAPPLGKRKTITAVILTAEGREVRKSMTIEPGGVDLIYESTGFVPPFYQGKASFSYENLIKVTAMPHLAGTSGAELDPRTLVYKWTINSKVIADQSGYGKQTLTTKESIPRDIDIQVEVGTKDGSKKAASSISLSPSDPAVTFYIEDPIYGVLYNKALGGQLRLTNQEINLRAVPYGFTTSARPSSLSYLWSINNLEQPDLSQNQSIVLRTKEDTEGSSNISLEVRNTREILQGARNAINIIFSKASAGNSGQSSATFQ